MVASRLGDYFVQLLCSERYCGVGLQLPLLFKQLPTPSIHADHTQALQYDDIRLPSLI
jgi:hypothetical protein